MHHRTLATTLVALILAGCATYDKPVPDNYSGPTVSISDSGEVKSSSLVHIFELTGADEKRFGGSHLATIVQNQGKGFSQSPVIITNKIPAKDMRVTLKAATVYAAPILAMMNPTCRVQGEVQFQPREGASYRVTGLISPEQCAVWVEDLATNLPVTEKIVDKGTK